MAAAEYSARGKPSKRLMIGRAVWWKPKPIDVSVGGLEQPIGGVELKLSFAAALKDLLENLSFHCYGKLVEQGRRFEERFLWLIYHIATLSVLIAFVWYMYNDSSEALITTIYDNRYPVSKVELPTISVCTLNRISKRAVWNYANELSSKDPMRRDADYFFQELRTFSMYYSSDEIDDYERVLAFQGFLDTFDTEPNELFFNPRKRLVALTPNCSEMLASCRLGGQYFDCMKHFRVSLAGQGYCCTFNLYGEYIKTSTNQLFFFGPYMGLRLTLRFLPNDEFYRLHKLNGFVVLVYEPNNYPDQYSGGVVSRFTQSGMMTNLPLRPKIFETIPEARHMSPRARKCLFENEFPQNLTRRYTFSNCISACRARSMFSLCQCLPFSTPIHYLDNTEGRVFCTLQHMECIRRYKFKWLNVITSREYVPELEHERQDALFCPYCLPSCTETRYDIHGHLTLNLNGLHKFNTSSSNSYSSRYISSNEANNSYSHDNVELALVNIYFAESHIQYFRQIIKNAWYENFSTIGNICGIIAGFSLIGICELLFFLAKQLWHAYKAELKSQHCQYRKRKGPRDFLAKRAQARTNGQAKATATARATATATTTQERQPMELLILP